MFDVERAIETWKAPFIRRHIYSQLDVAELEWHLRDVLDEELGRGLSAEDAFRIATSRVGEEPQLRSQFERNWNELNPFVRYGRSLSAEFQGWPSLLSLIGYSVARLVSGLVGYAALLLTFSGIATFLQFQLSPYELLSSNQSIFLTIVFVFLSAFNLFPFKRWENRWTDWLRLLYSAIVVLFTSTLLVYSAAEVSGLSLVLILLTVVSVVLGPVLWLKQVFMRRDYHLDLDNMVLSD